LDTASITLKNNVAVFATFTKAGLLSEHSLELLGDAQVLAQRLKGQVKCFLFIQDDIPLLDPVYFWQKGADTVHPLISYKKQGHDGQWLACQWQENLIPSERFYLLPATAIGEELAASLSYKLGGVPWVADGLKIILTRTLGAHIKALAQGGRMAQTLKQEAGDSVIVTFRPGVAEKKQRSGQGEAHIEQPIITKVTRRPGVQVKKRLPADPKTIDIRDANKIIAGGRGTSGSKGFEILRELCQKLGASLAGSRMAVDLGWIDSSRQVGQTGKQVKPELYLACGISGASHHIQGMMASKHIIAVNPDPKAAIHNLAHLSFKADLFLLLPAVIKKLGCRSADAASTDKKRAGNGLP
jgi:electron transfer flavoprotein alpha subunit